MRFRDLRAALKAAGKKRDLLQDFRFFHASPRADLTELRPSRFHIHGRMESAAVFVTTREHIGTWVSWVLGYKVSEKYEPRAVSVPRDHSPGWRSMRSRATHRF